MFGLFNKKKNDNKDEYDPDRITLDYEGGVISQGDYEAYTFNRNDPSFNAGINSFSVEFHTDTPNTTISIGMLKNNILFANAQVKIRT